MPKTLRTPRQIALTSLLVAGREAAGMTQQQLAQRLGRYQSVVAAIEGGSRRVDVVEFLDITSALGLDPHAVLDALLAVEQPR